MRVAKWGELMLGSSIDSLTQNQDNSSSTVSKHRDILQLQHRTEW